MLHNTVSNVLKVWYQIMEKMYSYDELAGILGCTRTAIAKKVKPDENNPSVERYKNRYRVVLHEGKKCIVIDDTGLEEEKNKSKGFKNVLQKPNITPEKQTIKGIETENTEVNSETAFDVTERYIDKFATLYKEFNDEIMKRDRQILLLTVDEKTKQDTYLQTQAEYKTLKEKYNVLEKKCNVIMNIIKGIVIFSLICITSFITFKVAIKNVSTVENSKVTDTVKEMSNPPTISTNIKKAAQGNPVPRNYKN